MKKLLNHNRRARKWIRRTPSYAKGVKGGKTTIFTKSGKLIKVHILNVTPPKAGVHCSDFPKGNSFALGNTKHTKKFLDTAHTICSALFRLFSSNIRPSNPFIALAKLKLKGFVKATQGSLPKSDWRRTIAKLYTSFRFWSRRRNGSNCFSEFRQLWELNSVFGLI